MNFKLYCGMNLCSYLLWTKYSFYFYFFIYFELAITFLVKPLCKVCKKINLPRLELCFGKVVIYNYVLCWLNSMRKSVVFALILFLVFCRILLYWV